MSTHRPHTFVLTNSVANPVLLPLLKGRAGAALGRRLAVIRYDGRRTGQPHELVALYETNGATVRISVGMATRKRWWRNFTTPHPVTLRLAGRDHTVLAHVERDGDAVTVTADLRVTRSTAPTVLVDAPPALPALGPDRRLASQEAHAHGASPPASTRSRS